MNSGIKGQVADTIVKLHSMIPEIIDFHEFTPILESSIKEIFHIDWLQLALFADDKGVNLVTSQSLPVNWEEKYGEIYDIDTIRIETFKRKIGG